jgi:transcriptional regulator with XRE-family HTH domain
MRLRVTIESLALISGVSAPSLSLFENRKRDLSPRLLTQIAKALHSFELIRAKFGDAPVDFADVRWLRCEVRSLEPR